MQIIVAPDSFKGSLTAAQAAENMAQGIACVLPAAEIWRKPIADGGEGTVALLAQSLGWTIAEDLLPGPTGVPLRAARALSPDGRIGLLEAAQTIGLTLIPQTRRDPGRFHSGSLGLQITSLLNQAVEEIWIGLGGSGTADGGIGMLHQLGLKLLDNRRNPINLCGEGLANLETIEWQALDPRLEKTRVKVLCDVDAPLCGPNGAARYMAQKGASPEQIQRLDSHLNLLADKLTTHCGRNLTHAKGAGAAGGLGAALLAIGGELLPGAPFCLRHMGLDPIPSATSLILTGEGCLDGQTAAGKAIHALIKLASKQKIPVVAIAGRLGTGFEKLKEAGLTKAYALAQTDPEVETCMRDAADALFKTTQLAIRDFLRQGF